MLGIEEIKVWTIIIWFILLCVLCAGSYFLFVTLRITKPKAYDIVVALILFSVLLTAAIQNPDKDAGPLIAFMIFFFPFWFIRRNVKGYAQGFWLVLSDALKKRSARIIAVLSLAWLVFASYRTFFAYDNWEESNFFWYATIPPILGIGFYHLFHWAKSGEA